MKKVKEKTLSIVADLFKIFSDYTRIRILYALQNEKSVNDLAESLDMNQTTISHQLRILKDHKLVKYRRENQTKYYSLDDEHVHSIINQGIEHVQE